jgi:hypothetical protein
MKSAIDIICYFLVAALIIPLWVSGFIAILITILISPIILIPIVVYALAKTPKNPRQSPSKVR